mmetsp:Transcript_156495/g.502181  ORF Transcript_156495/g.502181 Transcript_156495/m.502181 type:complete len:266 (+) Transcript_156495:585-1382(+)
MSMVMAMKKTHPVKQTEFWRSIMDIGGTPHLCIMRCCALTASTSLTMATRSMSTPRTTISGGVSLRPALYEKAAVPRQIRTAATYSRPENLRLFPMITETTMVGINLEDFTTTFTGYCTHTTAMFAKPVPKKRRTARQAYGAQKRTKEACCFKAPPLSAHSRPSCGFPSVDPAAAAASAQTPGGAPTPRGTAPAPAPAPTAVAGRSRAATARRRLRQQRQTTRRTKRATQARARPAAEPSACNPNPAFQSSGSNSASRGAQRHAS